MDPLIAMYYQHQRTVDLLRQQLRFPIVRGLNLPSYVDLRKWMTNIEDQGEMTSCVANAIAGKLLINIQWFY
jgi:hypothetical protein